MSALMLGAAVLVAGGGSAVGAADDVACGDLGADARSIELAPFEAGTATGHGNSVTVTNVRSAGGVMTFDWTATTALDAVHVGTADGAGALHSYDPPQLSASAVRSPRDSIGRVLFCWAAPPATTTTTVTVTSPVEPSPTPASPEPPPGPEPPPDSTPEPASTPTPAPAPTPTRDLDTAEVPPPEPPPAPPAAPPALISAASERPGMSLAGATLRVLPLVVIGIGMSAAGAYLLARDRRSAVRP